MLRSGIGAWGLAVGLSSVTFVAESSERHKCADEVTRFLESQEAGVQTARMLTGALPDLVGENQFHNATSSSGQRECRSCVAEDLAGSSCLR